MPLLVRRRSVLEFMGNNNNTADRPARGDVPRPTNYTGRTLKPASSSPTRPVSENGNSSRSRLSHELHPDDIPDASTDNDGSRRPNKRFSLMRFRNLSESHLAVRAKLDAERERAQEQVPPVPSITAEGVVPTIVKTAPTMDAAQPLAQHVEDDEQGDDERKPRPSLFKRASARGRVSESRDTRRSMDEARAGKKSSLKWRRGKTSGLEDLHRLSTMNISNQHHAPPSYGESSDSALAVPVSQLPDHRVSESSRSDGSNGSSADGHIYASTTTTTHTVSTQTTFFKLPRRNKNRNSLFPLPIKLPPPNESEQEQQGPATPRASQSQTLDAPSTSSTEHPGDFQLRRAHTERSPTKHRSQSALSSPNGAMAKSSLSFADPGMNLFRHTSSRSQNGSAASSPLQPPMRLGLRNRSSTTSSFGARSSHDAGTPPAFSASGRNSTSTTGRSSFGGLLTLSRFRQSSEPHSPRHGSPGSRSKSNSFAISREALVIPDREDGDTPGKYLERLESAVSRSVIAGILSKSADPFAQAVLRSYTRRFPFFTEPIDMSLRKYLLEAELPKETQQVDRVIQAFADRYHECNPGIFTASDSAYVIAFSIMMLHTDAFNKNNKRKMQKQDYLKNTSGQGISDDVLACFYDNICYTPFIHYDEDVDINGERVLPFKSKKEHRGKLKSAIPGADASMKKSAGPVDPYNLIVENKLDALRPSIKDSIMMDDIYDYRSSSGELDPGYLQRAFTHTGTIQIISARSRPAAYESQFINGQPNPTETQQGIVDLKITKVGTLWRKSAKKKKTRSPWQEWGAILTGSQLYLFKNAHWAKGLMHQFHSAQRPGQPRMPVVFKPPLEDFKPDALIKTDNAVALVDSSYTRHKNAFTFVRTGGQEETLLADNENELNDWLGLINYAAAFRAAGVRIRGMVGGNEEDTRSNGLSRLDSTKSTRSIQTQMGKVTVHNRGLTPQLQRQVMAARRQIMVQKISEIEKEVVDANRQLEGMLRNARHLLILAPIAPKTREDVIHAAARADAMIKWVRRDIWRMKAHRDILAMDVRIDGLSASELEKLTMNQPSEPESSRKHKPTMLTRLSSSKTAKSPPQSPLALTTPGRPTTRESFDNGLSGDIFRTPPESASATHEDGWRLPPIISLDATTQQGEHRPSVTSTLLSASPPGSHISLSHSASSSSMLRAQRTTSTVGSDGRTLSPTGPDVDDRQLQLLARSTMGPAVDDRDKSRGLSLDKSRGFSIDGPQSGASPDNKHKGVRRSLQKTLREHHPSTSHRHRRNKDSDSTVRSAGVDDKDAEEATPGLAREKPRFILHGKQASVVQFGGDWERMKLRRENYAAQSSSSPYQDQLDAAAHRRRSEQHELLRAGMASPVVQDLGRDTDDADTVSLMSEELRTFRQDAEAAAAYARLKSPSDSRPTSSSEASDVPEFFDLSSWDPEAGRRQTVIGPSPVAQSTTPARHRRYSSLQKSPDGNIEHVEDDGGGSPESSEMPAGFTTTNTNREYRRTVIGPSTPPPIPVRSSSRPSSSSRAGTAQSGHYGALRKIASAEARPGSGASPARHFASHHGSGSTSASAGAVDYDGESGSDDPAEDERGFVAAISDDELRRMSSSLSASASPQRMRVR